jgi:hypothetical protein
MYAAAIAIVLLLAWTLLPHEQSREVDTDEQDDVPPDVLAVRA